MSFWWTVLWVMLTIIVVSMVMACIRQVCCAINEDERRVHTTVVNTPAPAANAGNWSSPGIYATGVTIYPAPNQQLTPGAIYQPAPVNYAIGTNYVTGVYPATTYPTVIQGNPPSAPSANVGFTPEVHGSHNYPPPPKY